MDYSEKFEYHPKLLLAEDKCDLREEYRASLEQIGFEVDTAGNGEELEQKASDENKYHVILSDTDLSGEKTRYGDEIIRKLLGQGELENVLILGMSDNSDNAKYWRGICHHAGFFNKNNIQDLGEQVMSHYYNFVFGNDFWRMRSMKYDL